MKKIGFIVISIGLLLALAGCATSVENTQPAATESSASHVEEEHDHSDLFPYLGIWFSADRSSQLIINEAYLYYHEFATGREVYSQIRAVDLTENVIEVVMYDIIHSGIHVGFDSPTVTMIYQVNGEELQITLGSLSLDDSIDPVIFYRDEVLNP